MMNKFLNISDGLISIANKKLVFTTNLPNTKDIDDALMRKGRCFDIVEFRALNAKEARQVATDVGLERQFVDGESYMLTDIFNGLPEKRDVRGKIGF